MSDRPLVGSTKVELVRAHLGTVSLTGIGGTPVKMGLRRAVLKKRRYSTIEGGGLLSRGWTWSPKQVALT